VGEGEANEATALGVANGSSNRFSRVPAESPRPLKRWFERNRSEVSPQSASSVLLSVSSLVLSSVSVSVSALEFPEEDSL
jgi:hypothetical protein